MGEVQITDPTVRERLAQRGLKVIEAGQDSVEIVWAGTVNDGTPADRAQRIDATIAEIGDIQRAVRAVTKKNVKNGIG